MKTITDRRLDAWLRGWNDGAHGKNRAPPRAHADDYDRGFGCGFDAMCAAYGLAKLRIEAGTKRGQSDG